MIWTQRLNLSGILDRFAESANRTPILQYSNAFLQLRLGAGKLKGPWAPFVFEIGCFRIGCFIRIARSHHECTCNRHSSSSISYTRIAGRMVFFEIFASALSASLLLTASALVDDIPRRRIRVARKARLFSTRCLKVSHSRLAFSCSEERTDTQFLGMPYANINTLYIVRLPTL